MDKTDMFRDTKMMMNANWALDALLGPGVNPLEGSPNVKLRKLRTEGHAPGFQL